MTPILLLTMYTLDALQESLTFSLESSSQFRYSHVLCYLETGENLITADKNLKGILIYFLTLNCCHNAVVVL